MAGAAAATRVWRLNVDPWFRMWSRRPIRHTGSFFRTRAIEENWSSDGSTIVSAPPPTTSKVSSGPMNAAVFSSSPIPMAEVLVDDHAVGEAEPRGEGHDLGPRARALLAERDHVLAQERRARRRAGDVRALGVPAAERLGHGRAADH